MTLISANYLWASREGQTCNKLPNDNIFIAGGSWSPGTWEIRNSTGGLVSNGNLWASRDGHNAELQSDTGNVLITGGTVSQGTWELRSGTGALVSSGNLSGLHDGGHTTTEY